MIIKPFFRFIKSYDFYSEIFAVGSYKVITNKEYGSKNRYDLVACTFTFYYDNVIIMVVKIDYKLPTYFILYSSSEHHIESFKRCIPYAYIVDTSKEKGGSK